MFHATSNDGMHQTFWQPATAQCELGEHTAREISMKAELETGCFQEGMKIYYLVTVGKVLVR